MKTSFASLFCVKKRKKSTKSQWAPGRNLSLLPGTSPHSFSSEVEQQKAETSFIGNNLATFLILLLFVIFTFILPSLFSFSLFALTPSFSTLFPSTPSSHLYTLLLRFLYFLFPSTKSKEETDNDKLYTRCIGRRHLGTPLDNTLILCSRLRHHRPALSNHLPDYLSCYLPQVARIQEVELGWYVCLLLACFFLFFCGRMNTKEMLQAVKPFGRKSLPLRDRQPRLTLNILLLL